MHFAQRYTASSSSSSSSEFDKEEIGEVLQLCGLPPLLVVQILSSNASMSLSAVRPYI